LSRCEKDKMSPRCQIANLKFQILNFKLSASRCSTSCLPRPATLTTLFLLVSPLAMVTEARGISNKSAKNSITAWLARPSTGGAVSASFRASPLVPVIAFLRARGWTFTAKEMPLALSVSGIIGVAGSCGLRPGPEDGRADAHAGRAFFNRDLKIVRHAHGERVQVNAGQLARRNLVAQVAEQAKVRPRSFGVLSERRDRHQAAELKMREPRSGAEHALQFRRIQQDAGLAGFVADLDFDQHVELSAALRGGLVQLLRQAEGVQRVDGGKKLCSLLCLVALQMADQMPLDVFQFVQGGRLAVKFLHAIFAEHADPGRVGLADPLRLHGLAHRHERDRAGIAAHPRSGTGHALTNGSDVVGDGHGTIIGESRIHHGGTAIPQFSPRLRGEQLSPRIRVSVVSPGYFLSNASTLWSSTSAPFSMSCGRENSFGEWLMPPVEGIKIMPTGPMRAIS